MPDRTIDQPYTVVGPTLDMIGYDPASYNAGASAGYTSGALQTAGPPQSPASQSFGAFVTEYQSAIVAGAAVLLLLAILHANNN